jgi:hypothetical protein
LEGCGIVRYPKRLSHSGLSRLTSNERRPKVEGLLAEVHAAGSELTDDKKEAIEIAVVGYMKRFARWNGKKWIVNEPLSETDKAAKAAKKDQKLAWKEAKKAANQGKNGERKGRRGRNSDKWEGDIAGMDAKRTAAAVPLSFLFLTF